MKRLLLSLLLVVALLPLVSSAETILGPFTGTTTGYSAEVDVSSAAQIRVHVFSEGTSSATVLVETRVANAGGRWTTAATITDPTDAGEQWLIPPCRAVRIHVSVHASGTISGVVVTRTSASGTWQ